MPGATERMIDWTVRFLQAANVAAKDREAPFFAVLAAISFLWKQYYSGFCFAVCMAACHTLAYYTVDKGPLPTREGFLKSVPTVHTDSECPVCYDDDADQHARLACCGHQLCNDCLLLVYGPDHRDNRCPTCRQPLFRIRAPWNNTAIKIAFCRSLMGLVESALEFALQLLDKSPKSRFLRALGLFGTGAWFIFCGWALVGMVRRLDSNSASFWRALMNEMQLVAFWPVFFMQTLMSAISMGGKWKNLAAAEYDGVKDLIVIE